MIIPTVGTNHHRSHGSMSLCFFFWKKWKLLNFVESWQKHFFTLLWCQRLSTASRISNGCQKQQWKKYWPFYRNGLRNHISWNTHRHPKLLTPNTRYKLTGNSCKREAANKLEILRKRKLFAHSMLSCFLRTMQINVHNRLNAVCRSRQFVVAQTLD